MAKNSHNSEHFSARPPGIDVDTIIIHSMSNPKEQNPTSIRACVAALREFKVSAHYLISRRGSIAKLVDEVNAAWHAGESRMPDGRTKVNEFSVGIELLNIAGTPFTDSQYRAVAMLTKEIISRNKIKFILGHELVAQPSGRKTDPGPKFEWERYREELRAAGVDCSNLEFGDQL